MTKSPDTVVMKESRRFELDFGYIDCVCSVLFCVALWLRSSRRAQAGKPHAWVVHNACHYFGIFAFFADYVLYYHIQGTRTVEYPNGDEPMGPLGNFLFFFWFDWINGAVIVMWAMLVCEDLLMVDARGEQGKQIRAKNGWNESEDRAPFWMFVAVPLWFWSTPPLSRFELLPLDNRLLLVTRPSEKDKYWVLMVIFMAVMKVIMGMSFRQVLRVLLSGIGCGLIHHAPLFFFGMRGYSSPTALVVTLCTEWPAIMMGLFVITKLLCGLSSPASKPSREESKRGQRTGLALFALVLAFGCVGTKASVRGFIYEIMPYVPAKPYQKLGQLYLRAHCALPSLRAPLPCNSDSQKPIWVAAAAQKGAAVMTAMISLDTAQACGRCVGIGDRPNGDWPNPVETPPPYASDALLAIANMPKWPEYVAEQGSPGRCIVMLRDPLARLVSTFLYAKAGREPWFREHGVDKRINVLIGSNVETPEDLRPAVDYMLQRFGMAYVQETHDYLMFNMRQGCTAIRYEQLRNDFEGTMQIWFDAWGITSDAEVRKALLRSVAEHNPSIQTTDNHHATGALFSESFKENVRAAFLADAALNRTVMEQRRELGYGPA